MNEENEQYDLISPPVITEATDSTRLTDSYVVETGKQLILRKQLLAICVTALRPHDIQDFGGRPYIEGEGAARIMAVVRDFHVGEAVFEEREESGHWFVQCALPIEWRGATTIGYGDCSTVDAFFTGSDGKSGIFKRHMERTGGNERLAARLILGDAKKKARENAISRGVCELLGLKGLTWSDLEGLGFKRSEAGVKVEFKKGKQGGAPVNIDLAGAKDTPAGSTVDITAQVQSVEVIKTKTGKDVTKCHVLDATGTGVISLWGIHEDIKTDGWYDFRGVTIKQFQGTNYYTAQEAKPFENPLEGGTK